MEPRIQQPIEIPPQVNKGFGLDEGQGHVSHKLKGEISYPTRAKNKKQNKGLARSREKRDCQNWVQHLTNQSWACNININQSDSARVRRMSELTPGGTAKPASRDQSLRRERGQGKCTFPVQLTTSRIGSHTRLIHILLKVLTIHT